jgi:hypothetical protein
VYLVEVDHVGPEVLQRGFEFRRDLVSAPGEGLAREKNAIAVPCERPPHLLFATRIGAGAVEKIDTGLEGVQQQPLRFGEGDPLYRDATEADGGNHHVRPAEPPFFHDG